MFTRLLIPLDGSKLAEAVLPAAAYLAKTLEIPVTLLHIIERNAPEEIHGETHLTNEAEARTYLDSIASQKYWPDVVIESHVHTAEVTDVAESIVAHANELQTDLIVLCTHGSGGLRSLVIGTIAQQVINLGRTPVLVIQADQSGVSAIFDCRRMLIALDGKPDHEKGLRVAAELAENCEAGLHLVTVVPTRRELLMEQAATARFLPGSTSALLDLSVSSAENYLLDLVHEYAQRGIPHNGRSAARRTGSHADPSCRAKPDQPDRAGNARQEPYGCVLVRQPDAPDCERHSHPPAAGTDPQS